MQSNDKSLTVLGCSETKIRVGGYLPAICLYDGPVFRVLRSFLRDYRWPESLSVAVLSAKYGLIGGLSQIETYDQRMTSERAKEIYQSATDTLIKWSKHHHRVEFVLGQDYIRSIDHDQIVNRYRQHRIIEGPIGMKLNWLHNKLRSAGAGLRTRGCELPTPDRA
jgi:hypothetical protein